jgi:hypothetical protein
MESLTQLTYDNPKNDLNAQLLQGLASDGLLEYLVT